LLGVELNSDWVERLNRSLAGHHQARARRKAARKLNLITSESDQAELALHSLIGPTEIECSDTLANASSSRGRSRTKNEHDDEDERE
jgi:hypothetical protein